MDNKDFEALIKKDRDMHQSRSWRGNLLGYLEKVKADPTIAKLSHARHVRYDHEAGRARHS